MASVIIIKMPIGTLLLPLLLMAMMDFLFSFCAVAADVVDNVIVVVATATGIVASVVVVIVSAIVVVIVDDTFRVLIKLTCSNPPSV